MATNYTIKIGGVLQNLVQGSLNVTNQIGQRSTGRVKVWTPNNTFWKYGTHVEIYDANNALAYAGFTSKDKITKQSRTGRGYLEHEIDLMDMVYKADKRLVFGKWINKSAGSIVKSIWGQVLAAEGVTIGAIADGATITKVVWNGKQASSAITWLASTCGYWWMIDLNAVLWFLPYGGVAAPFVLDGTQVAVDTNLSVTYGNDLFCTRQYVKGGKGTKAFTENQEGDGNKRSFAMPFELASVDPSDITIFVNGVAQTWATKGSVGSQWYVALNDSIIAQDPGQVLLATTDTFKATAKGAFPILVRAESRTLEAAQKIREGGGTGYVESEYISASIYDQSQAFQIAQALLSHYGQDMTLLEFDTRTAGLAPGQSLTVSGLGDFGLPSTTQMLIQSVEISDSINTGFNIWFHVLAVGSPVEAATWPTFWQSLMNQQPDPSAFDNTDDAGLALFEGSVITLSPSVHVNFTKNVCTLCGPTACGGTTPKVC